MFLDDGHFVFGEVRYRLVDRAAKNSIYLIKTFRNDF